MDLVNIIKNLRDTKVVLNYLVKENKNLQKIIHENEFNYMEIDRSDSVENELL